MVLFHLFVFGLFVGSFLNVLIDRLPKGENVLTDRSRCDHCNKTLAWYDLIPLLSFLSTGGRCRYCKYKLTPYYPLIELTTGFLFALTYLFVMVNGQWSMVNLLYYLFLVSSMIVVFFSDLKYGIIPDKIIFPMIGLSLAYFFISNQASIFIHLLTALAVFAFFLGLFLLTRGKAMGFGDVKFSFLLGLVLGPINSILALYVAFLTGAAVGIILILWRKKRLKEAVPFGPFLVLGFLTSFFLGPQILIKLSTFI